MPVRRRPGDHRGRRGPGVGSPVRSRSLGRCAIGGRRHPARGCALVPDRSADPSTHHDGGDHGPAEGDAPYRYGRVRAAHALRPPIVAARAVRRRRPDRHRASGTGAAGRRPLELRDRRSAGDLTPDGRVPRVVGIPQARRRLPRRPRPRRDGPRDRDPADQSASGRLPVSALIVASVRSRPDVAGCAPRRRSSAVTP